MSAGLDKLPDTDGSDKVWNCDSVTSIEADEDVSPGSDVIANVDRGDEESTDDTADSLSTS